jgi:FKBP-type peptidyl-prolyl cis-trans isomerase FklB
MKPLLGRSLLTLGCVITLLLSAGCTSTGSNKVALKDTSEKASYAFGIKLGQQLRESPTEIDLQAFQAGVDTAYHEKKPLISSQEMTQAIGEFQRQQAADLQKKQQQTAQENAAASAKFLAENKQKPGVITLPSGLQYKIIKPGRGPKPTADDQVEVNYKGTLPDGTVFDSSYQRGQPATFGLSSIIPGWSEALKLMPQGSEWRIFVPANLAYGARGAGSAIGPNQALVFDIDLLKVIKPAKK